MIKTLTRRSFLRNVFFAVLTVALSLGVGACSDNGTNSANGSISGTLTFTYKGKSITAHSDKWPNGGDSTANFPAGYFRIGIIPALSNGVPSTGPTKVLPVGTGTGSGMTYGQLTNGKYVYQFDKIGKGTYFIAPTFQNTKDNDGAKIPSFRDVVPIGYYSDAMVGYGTIFNVNEDTHTNIDMYCDMAIAEYAYTIMKTNTDGGSAAGIIGGVKLTNPADWPTGTKYLGVAAYTAYSTKQEVVNAGHPAPACFALVPKPDVGDMMSYKVDAILGHTYKLVIVDVFNDASCTQFTSEGVPPLATLTSPYFTVPVTLAKTSPNLPMIIWNTRVTVPTP